MIRYYKTTGIYAESDLLRLEVKYDKDRSGYCAYLTPCHKDNEHCFSVYYCKEYYAYYGTFIQPLVRCGRRSKKQEESANAICDKMIEKLLAKYVEVAETKGGRHIEIIGEIEEWRN